MLKTVQCGISSDNKYISVFKYEINERFRPT